MSNIQQNINSMIGSVGQAAGIAKGIKTLEKSNEISQATLQEQEITNELQKLELQGKIQEEVDKSLEASDDYFEQEGKLEEQETNLQQDINNMNNIKKDKNGRWREPSGQFYSESKYDRSMKSLMEVQDELKAKRAEIDRFNRMRDIVLNKAKTFNKISPNMQVGIDETKVDKMKEMIKGGKK